MIDGDTITVERAAELLHCGRTTVFALINAGHLDAAPRFGRRRTVFTEQVRRLALEGLPRPGRKPRARAERPVRSSKEEIKALLRRHTAAEMGGENTAEKPRSDLAPF